MSLQRTVDDRFWEKVEKTDSCWLWMACTHRDGYGKFAVAGGVVYAHRWAYESLVGPIPDGLTIDHLCRVRNCVNPAHMEPVTSGENSLRGNGPTAVAARQTRCPQGHPYDEANTYFPPTGGRQCKTCRKVVNAQRISCDLCGTPPMHLTNIYAHRRTLKHLSAVAAAC